MPLLDVAQPLHTKIAPNTVAAAQIAAVVAARTAVVAAAATLIAFFLVLHIPPPRFAVPAESHRHFKSWMPLYHKAPPLWNCNIFKARMGKNTGVGTCVTRRYCKIF